MTGFVPLRSFSKKEAYVVDEDRQSITGMYSGRQFRIGDDVVVQLEWVDFDRLETVFNICDSN